MSKLTKEEFQAYLKQIRELAEGPLEEIQKEVEVTNKFPQEFYDLAIENNLYRCSLPEEYGGWGLNELEILQVQEEFSRGPGGMRMHLHLSLIHIWHYYHCAYGPDHELPPYVLWRDLLKRV